MARAIQELIWLTGTAIYQHWFELECRGQENLPQQGGYIIAANHTSHLDAPAIIAAHGQHLNFIYSLAAQDYFFDHPMKSWICHHWLNMIPFKRQGKFLDCLPACQEIIRQHKSILFFPEGTRSATGTLQPFKLGLGMLAVKLNVPIVPTLVQGTYRALPKGKYLPKRYPIRVTFGSPVKCDRYLLTHNLGNERQIYREIVNAVALEVQNLQQVTK